ncbi:diacylglycerol kinase family protein [Jannaschia sp. W003]|uniref:diacylglycerol/lipid kinase family protein n=1 Tax=Jannaschia sp. W003 TaxID=2867012 RepID=UPI0021A70935|nr:diacylglycerol kinase family protein [Jannaschia sp. W003]UWQ21486.1 hypothetical protein K3554_00160 [Jannaschia sp. W003]
MTTFAPTDSAAPAAPALPRVLMLVNRGSGRRSREALAAVAEAARARAGFEVEVIAKPAALMRRAREAAEAGAPVIAAAGGDGTMSGVADAIRGTGTRLGVVPMGTFNFLARSLGIPEDPEEALGVLERGQARPILLGEVNGRSFVNNASLGAYASVLQMRETTYKRWGRSRLAAYWSVITAMATLYRPLHMAISVDGRPPERMRSPMAFVATCAYQLEQYGFEGVDAVRRGELALFLAPDVGRLQLLWLALRVMAGRMRRGVDYRLVTGREILIETARPNRLVARDGERERMRGPYRFRALTDALEVIAPSEAPLPEAA